MNEDVIFLGTEVKLNIALEPLDSYSMADYDFECEFYCYSSKRVVLAKDAMLPKDKNNYIAVLNTRDVGTGALKCKITAFIPDTDCDDGLRTEVLVIDTGIQIVGA